MTIGRLKEIIQYFNDEDEIIIYDYEHQAVVGVEDACRNGNALQLNIYEGEEKEYEV